VGRLPHVQPTVTGQCSDMPIFGGHGSVIEHLTKPGAAVNMFTSLLLRNIKCHIY